MKTTCSSPALSGGVFFNPELSEAKAMTRQVGSGPGTLPPGWVCLAAGRHRGGFRLPRDAVTLGGLLSQAVVDKRCVPPSPPSSLDGATREPEVAVAGGSHES